MVGGNKKIHEHPNHMTQGFHVNPQNINKKGRPRKLIKTTIDEIKNDGIQVPSKNEIFELYLLLLNVPIPQLQEITQNDMYSAITRICAKNILSGKGFDVVEKMLDRAIGRPQNYTDVTTAGEKLNINIIEGNGGD